MRRSVGTSTFKYTYVLTLEDEDQYEGEKETYDSDGLEAVHQRL
jgi:hypothetical protein